MRKLRQASIKASILYIADEIPQVLDLEQCKKIILSESQDFWSQQEVIDKFIRHILKKKDCVHKHPK